jgi:hypothetical protein
MAKADRRDLVVCDGVDRKVAKTERRDFVVCDVVDW